MTSVFSFLIVMLAVIFWGIRVAVAICYTVGTNIGIEPINLNIEIVLLFITLICFIFIFKRNIFGALVYFLCNGMYFGTDLYNRIVFILSGQALNIQLLPIILSFFGILIPFLIVMDIFLNREGVGKDHDERTDWFFDNQDFDRKHDERADENQYRF